MTKQASRPVGWSTNELDGVLGPCVGAGVVGNFEVQLVRAVLRRAPTRPTDDCLLALALSARAMRLGHVCLDLRTAHDQVVASQDDQGTTEYVALPDPESWRAELAASPIVSVPAETGATPGALLRPLVLDGFRLYLQRFWQFEVEVAAQLEERSGPVSGITLPDDPDARVEPVLVDLFGGTPVDEDGRVDLQFVAARRALTRPVTVIAGGPGTGKTHTVARILAAAHELAGARGEVVRVALAAPTGKAATRMKEAVETQVAALLGAGRIDEDRADALRAIEPTTIHRLLGRRSRTSFRHDRDDPLPHDLVVVDETSMVSLPLLSRLLDGVRPEARLVLVGDPFQLASIEAGTVMGDMVGPSGRSEKSATAPLGGRVTELRVGHRFDAGSGIAELALAIRDGHADRVVDRLVHGSGVHWVRPDDPAGLAALRAQVVAAATEVVRAALEDDGLVALKAVTRIKVLAAVRRGPLGLFDWSDLIDGAALGAVPVALRGGRPRVGTPVMVTHNDPVNRLANGDVGVVVHAPDGRWVVMAGSPEPRRLAPARLGEWEGWWAMTIHKSQGSEFPHAVVSLPTVDSPILTRELLYTAVTRAKDEVTLVGSEEIIRLAVDRPVARASGLSDRLWPGT
jgi:exodeoxyribonuclease V alpha subunit